MMTVAVETHAINNADDLLDMLLVYRSAERKLMLIEDFDRVTLLESTSSDKGKTLSLLFHHSTPAQLKMAAE